MMSRRQWMRVAASIGLLALAGAALLGGSAGAPSPALADAARIIEAERCSAPRVLPRRPSLVPEAAADPFNPNPLHPAREGGPVS